MEVNQLDKYVTLQINPSSEDLPPLENGLPIFVGSKLVGVTKMQRVEERKVEEREVEVDLDGILFCLWTRSYDFIPFK